MNEREHFVELLRGLPLVSVDLVLVRGGTEILLGLRTNRPAQGSWFVPGGRILKDEPRADALKRVAARELGIADVAALKPQLLGVFEHFYPDCFAGDIGVSTHYVVIAHRINVPPPRLRQMQTYIATRGTICHCLIKRIGLRKRHTRLPRKKNRLQSTHCASQRSD